MTKWQNSMKRKRMPQTRLNRYGQLSRLLRPIAIAIILGYLTTLCACSTASNERIKESCVKSVVTYGDAIECMVRLNEVQQ